MVDGRDEEPCGGAFDGSFEVFGEASVPVQPGDGPFDDPAARQQFEALDGVGSLDDFEAPSPNFGERGTEFVPGIAAIGEDVTQPREAVADAGEDIWCAVAILDIGGVHDGRDQQALRVGEDMTLAALDLFAGVESPWTSAFRRFHALAIDDSCTGRGLTPHRFACHQQ